MEIIIEQRRKHDYIAKIVTITLMEKIVMVSLSADAVLAVDNPKWTSIKK